MSPDQIGFAIIISSLTLMGVLAALQLRGAATYLLTAAVTVTVLRLAAWQFSWWIVAASWVLVVLTLAWPRSKAEKASGSKLYIYRGGNTAHRIRFDDEEDQDVK